MTRARAVLPWLLPYALSVALTKGVALVTIPLITGHLSPVEFARLELVATIVEIAGLALAVEGYTIADPRLDVSVETVVRNVECAVREPPRDRGL